MQPLRLLRIIGMAAAIFVIASFVELSILMNLFANAWSTNSIPIPAIVGYALVFGTPIILIVSLLWSARRLKRGPASNASYDTMVALLTAATLCFIAYVLLVVVVLHSEADARDRQRRQAIRSKANSAQMGRYNAAFSRGCQDKYYITSKNSGSLAPLMSHLREKDPASYKSIANELALASNQCVANTISPQQQADIIAGQKAKAKGLLQAYYSDEDIKAIEAEQPEQTQLQVRPN